MQSPFSKGGSDRFLAAVLRSVEFMMRVMLYLADLGRYLFYLPQSTITNSFISSSA
jgi:hypothetical protein